VDKLRDDLCLGQDQPEPHLQLQKRQQLDVGLRVEGDEGVVIGGVEVDEDLEAKYEIFLELWPLLNSFVRSSVTSLFNFFEKLFFVEN
jgi:hypothetical protein